MLAIIISGVIVAGLYGPAEKPMSSVERKSFDLDGLPIRVSWPKGSTGPLPVFVFSHGMYGSRDGYDPLVDSIAGNGYAVIQPSHADSLSRMTREQRLALLRNPNTDSTQNWNERPGEISECIDALSVIAKKTGVTLDAKRLAVGGHSFGAWTTQMLAGMELGAGARKFTAYEPRAKAYVVLSATGPGSGVSEQGLKAMHGPMLFVTGDNDTGRKGDTAEWRRKAFKLSSSGDRWQVWIDDAAHNFGGLTGERTGAVREFLKRAGSSADLNPKHTALAKSAVLSFLDAYVKQDAAARTYLKNEDIEKAGGAQVSSK